MIAIDNVLLSDDIVEQHFLCDLQSCKGGCCVDGDCGAPLTEGEALLLKEIYPKIKDQLPAEHIAEIEKQGTHVTDDEVGLVTPIINGGICVYAYVDESRIVKCGIEKAWKEGIVDFQKPISCHLFPIRIKEADGYDLVNYEPRKTLCKPACKLGNKVKLPVYKFLQNALVRKYGETFYETLEAVAEKIRSEK